MPLYNSANYLYYSIRSIQNQKMKEIEIIVINDASTDNTLEILEKLMNEDSRIKLINNEKNRRILYSKSIGALYANGKYILVLDQDDMFITEDAFDILYNNAEKNNLDTLQFRDISLKNFILENNMNYSGMILSQNTSYEIKYELKYLMFKKYNLLLWGLLIKSDLYKRAVIHLWKNIINYKIIHYEDYTLTFFIGIFSKKFKYLNNFYLAHLCHNNSATFNEKYKLEYNASVLIFYNYMYEYHVKNNPKDIKIFINIINSKKRITFYLQKNFPELFEFVFKKILDYFPFEQKKKYMILLKLNSYNITLIDTYKYFMNKKEYQSIKIFQNKIIKSRNKHIIIKNKRNPKFTILIYCKQKEFLINTLYSIENQKKFYLLEIIIVFDNNDKKVLNYINKLIKDYKNIKLVNNGKEKGLFYSYYIGVNLARGEFILTIKSGYTLSHENVFYELNKKIDDNTEILEFNLLINHIHDHIISTSLKLYRCSHFKSSINITFLKFNKNYKQIDQEKELIINKLIKANIYKFILNKYKYFFAHKIKDNYYDEIIIFLINQNNYSIKHVDDFGLIGYLKVINNLNSKKINPYKNLVRDSISYVKFLYSHSNNSVKDKQFVLNEFFNIMNVIYNKFSEVSKEGKNLIFKFLRCKYISKYEKKNLITYYNVLIDRNKYNKIDYKIS